MLVGIVAALLLQKYRLSRAIALGALLCTLVFDWRYFGNLSKGTELALRNFYGTLRVIDLPRGVGLLRQLKHGVIVHGSQILDPLPRDVPTTYYGESSGIGRTL